MLLEKPSPSLGIGDPTCGMRRQVNRLVGGAPLASLLSPPAARSSRTAAVAVLVLEQLLMRPLMRARSVMASSVMMVRR
jgi:hypothetical protein